MAEPTDSLWVPQAPPPAYGTMLEVFGFLVNEAHATALSKGWWDREKNKAEIAALLHSEISEAFEAARGGDDRQWLIELADVVIRIFDWLGREEATEQFLVRLLGKMAYNKERPYRHGGKKW